MDVHAGKGECGEEGGVGNVDEALPRQREARRLGQVLRGGKAQAAERRASEVQDVLTIEHFRNYPHNGSLLLNQGENNKLQKNKLCSGKTALTYVRREMSLNLAPIVHEAEAGGVARVGADE